MDPRGKTEKKKEELNSVESSLVSHFPKHNFEASFLEKYMVANTPTVITGKIVFNKIEKNLKTSKHACLIIKLTDKDQILRQQVLDLNKNELLKPYRYGFKTEKSMTKPTVVAGLKIGLCHVLNNDGSLGMPEYITNINHLDTRSTPIPGFNIINLTLRKAKKKSKFKYIM